jgi:MoCo/4Fe-4S cofactor protein with predicted Tat translocation signal
MRHHSTQRDYWRSLEHLAQTPRIVELTHHEFSEYDPDEMLKLPPVTRRRFVQLMGASMALAGLTLSGCRRWPEEKLAPYTSNPAGRIPGKPEQYATLMQVAGVAMPLLVTAFDGRPIKIEGNPTHPFSQTIAGKVGSADAIAQASVLELYDPDRSKTVVDRSGAGPVDSDWNGFLTAMAPAMSALAAAQGDGLVILSEQSSSLTTARMWQAVRNKLPKARWVEYESLSRDNERAGIKLALGKPGRTFLQLDQATVVVSIDADPLGSHPAHTRYASDWGLARSEDKMSRVYVAESAFTCTGSVADERIGVKPSRLGAILGALAAKLGVGSGDEPLTAPEQQFVDRAAADLKANPGKGVVAVGSHLSPEYHALAVALNRTLGGDGTTVRILQEEDDDRPSHFDAIADLVNQIKAGKVTTLIILGGNPAYDCPADIDFATALKSVPLSAHLSLYDNETSLLCRWHIPRAHYLEAWSDARAWDGGVIVGQPLILPLYDGKTSDQILAALAGLDPSDSLALVRQTYQNNSGAQTDAQFRQSLNDGLMPGWEFTAIATALSSPPSLPAAQTSTGFEIRFLQDASVYDGRFAGNGWLQEMPDGLTKLVWDNAALISIKDAEQLGVSQGDMLKISLGGRDLTIAAYIMPGQPIGVIGLPLGYGRTAAGHIGTGVGFNTYIIRTSASPYAAAGATVSKTGANYPLATTQDHYLLDAIGANQRDLEVGKEKHVSGEIILETTFDEYKNDPNIFQRKPDGSISLQLFDPPRVFTGDTNDPHAWGMAIDLSSCIGCHACVVACQAENNVPIVGKDQVFKNRQMHWIRIDRYFKGDPDQPEVVYQPMTCQQCENAPCEQVCPVGATMHDTEGINVMVYNRCVGTRYCSNNCPYKVRRFNYLDWRGQDPRSDKYPKPYPLLPDMQDRDPKTIDLISRMVFNPEVTVRMRGVMEKCTYCVQRIHTTKIAKRVAGETVEDGDILTACQQACPTRAIVFGDLCDPNSKVSQLHKNNRAYALLDEQLNTRPRNRYLAKLSNPVENPPDDGSKESHG